MAYLASPITAVNNLVTIPTTATSAKPVIIAIGNILRKDLRLLIDKQFGGSKKVLLFYLISTSFY